MTNLLFTLLLYGCLFIEYRFLGFCFCRITGYKPGGCLELIAGFFGLYFILWFPGTVCQILSSSWNQYAVSAGLFWAAAHLALCWFLFASGQFREFKLLPGGWSGFRQWLASHWLVIIMALVFTGFSISNLMPLVSGGYDDFYYISKIVNSVEIDHLGIENYYTGVRLASPALGLERFVNTYELSYALQMSLFKIDPAYFCRVTMNLHNYFFWFLILVQCARTVLKETVAQFSLLVFLIFLIPDGYWRLADIGFNIFSYDMWQSQTAMFYGASVVRTMSFPALFLFAHPLFDRMNWRQCMAVTGLCLSFLSFSTIFIQNGLFFLLAALMVKSLESLWTGARNKKWLKALAGLAGIVCLGALYWFSDILLSFIPAGKDPAVYIDLFNDYLLVWYSQDILTNYVIAAGAAGLLFWALKKGRVLFEYIVCLSLPVWIAVVTGTHLELFVYTSIFTNFVTLRTISAIQYLILLAAGILLAKVWDWFRSPQAAGGIFSGLCIAGSIGVFVWLEPSFINYTGLGNGISEAGWDFSRLLTLDYQMVPALYEQVGDYFNSLPYGNYRVLASSMLQTEYGSADSVAFLMTSNRIEKVVPYDTSWGEAKSNAIFSLLDGSGSYEEALYYLQEEQVDFIVSDKPEVTQTLQENGWKLVLEESSPSYVALLEAPETF